MFCPKCGKPVDESDAFCRSCGHTLSTEKPASAGTAPASDTPGTLGVAKAVEPVKRSGEATASLILGLFSFVPIVGLLAVIFGHLARASIRRSGGRLLGDGMAVFGLLLGYLGLGAWVIYGLSVLVQPSLPSSRRAANEHSAVGSLRTINTAAITYASTYNRGFPSTLAALGPPKNANPNLPTDEYIKLLSANGAGLIDEVLTSGTKSGYRFTYVAGKVDVAGMIDNYTVHADPVSPGETGDKHFFIDESGVIRMAIDKPANAESTPISDAM
jgi:type II secretory pathway pseudopilin PulG